MVDLHCHILPHIDDGAKTCDDSIGLIKIELQSGVDTIAVTPHYNFEHNHGIEDYCRRRAESYKELKEALIKNHISMRVIVGSEVFLSPGIVSQEGREALQYEGTNYMLVELPTDHFYDWIPKVLYNLRVAGIVPVIAHVERYPSVMSHTDRLYDMVVSGAVIQVNATALVKGGHKLREKIFDLINHNLVHLIATDTHSLDKRPPMMKDALKIISKEFGMEMVQYFSDNSYCIIDNKEIYADEPQKLKKKKHFIF